MAYFNDRSLANKLRLGYALLISVLTVVGGLSWYYLLNITAQAQAITESNLAGAVHLANAQDALWRLRYGFPQFLVVDAADRATILEEEPRWYEQVETNMAAYAAIERTPVEQELLNTWTDIYNRYKGARPRWFELQLAGKTEEAALWRGQTTTPYGRDAVATLESLIQIQRDVATEKELALEQSAELALTILGVVVVLALAGSTAFMIFFPRTITRPLSTMTQAIEVVKTGDLSQQVLVTSRDEIGRLGYAFNQMIVSLRASRDAEEQARAEELRRQAVEQNLAETERLRQQAQLRQGELEQLYQQTQQLQAAETKGRQQLEEAVADYLAFVEQVAQGTLTKRLEIRYDGALGQLGHGLNGMVENLQRISRQVQQAVSNLTNVAAAILSNTTQQATSATEQSAALVQTASTIQQVKAIAQQTARQATQVTDDSHTALQIARQGTQIVEEAVSGFNDISTQVATIATTIQSLSSQAQTIRTIIQTVNELADQSNMLALNAAIEAARAGEQGRSFAIVAQHVRDLAERSKKATAQVRTILGEIQGATQAAVRVTQAGTKSVEVGAQLTASAGEIIHQIAADVEHGAQANVQMAAAAQQQTTGMEQIEQAMQAMQQATGQTLHATREAASAAQDLNALAQSLQRTIDIYRL